MALRVLHLAVVIHHEMELVLQQVSVRKSIQSPDGILYQIGEKNANIPLCHLTHFLCRNTCPIHLADLTHTHCTLANFYYFFPNVVMLIDSYRPPTHTNVNTKSPPLLIWTFQLLNY